MWWLWYELGKSEGKREQELEQKSKTSYSSEDPTIIRDINGNLQRIDYLDLDYCEMKAAEGFEYMKICDIYIDMEDILEVPSIESLTNEFPFRIKFRRDLFEKLAQFNKDKSMKDLELGLYNGKMVFKSCTISVLYCAGSVGASPTLLIKVIDPKEILFE